MYEQVCYQKSYLKQVIAKIDFASPLLQIQNGVPSKLLKTIIENFSIVEPGELINQEFLHEGESLQFKQTMIKQWNYYSKDRSRQLTLSAESIFVVYTIYKSYEETKEQFGIVIDALSKAFPETKASRFGLRYINQIELVLDDATKWKDLINAKLLGSRDFFENTDSLTRLISIAELQYEDISVRFQFGMPNPDYPAPIKRPLFILDLDGSVSQAHDLTETPDYMDQAHSHIQKIYERSITDSLRGKMDARPVQK